MKKTKNKIKFNKYRNKYFKLHTKVLAETETHKIIFYKFKKRNYKYTNKD